MTEALASIPATCDREIARRLFIEAERGFLIALYEAKMASKQDGRQ